MSAPGLLLPAGPCCTEGASPGMGLLQVQSLSIIDLLDKLMLCLKGTIVLMCWHLETYCWFFASNVQGKAGSLNTTGCSWGGCAGEGLARGSTYREGGAVNGDGRVANVIDKFWGLVPSSDMRLYTSFSGKLLFLCIILDLWHWL